MKKFYGNFGIPVELVATAIQQIIEVLIDTTWNEVIIRPTKQIQ